MTRCARPRPGASRLPDQSAKTVHADVRDRPLSDRTAMSIGDVDHRDAQGRQVLWRLPRPARYRPDRLARRAHRHLRPVRLRQIDADPLPEPARGASEGRDRHRRHDRPCQAARASKIVRREIGMVFQSFNLFPHLTALENCTLAPMKVRGIAESRGRGDRPQDPGARPYPRAGRTNTRSSCRAASSSASRSRARSA